jgi:hypothetical protein
MDPHDTPDTPSPDQMRAEVHAYIAALDDATLTALWRLLRTVSGPVPWWWQEDGGEA